MTYVLPLQIVAAGFFALSTAAIIDLLGTRARHARAEKTGLDVGRDRMCHDSPRLASKDAADRTTLRRRMVAEGAVLHVTAAVSGIYLSVTAEPFGAIFPLGCWLYLGYWVFVRRRGRAGRP